MKSNRAAAILLLLAACGETSPEPLSLETGDAGAGALGDGDAGTGAGNREAGSGQSGSAGGGSGDAGRSQGGGGANDGGRSGDGATTRPDRDGGAKGPPDAGGFIDAPESDAPGAPTIGDDGYLSISTGPYVLVGYVSSFVGGSSSSIALTYGASSFCASGTVGENTTYQSYAGAGFTVDQARSAAGGSVSALLLSGTSMTVSFANYDSSPLELQLTGSGNTYWCYELGPSQSPVVIPLSSFNTQCWDDGGDAFVPGTAITSIDLVVPGSASGATPYGFCFLGLTIQ
jgi:hypothetical protein